MKISEKITQNDFKEILTTIYEKNQNSVSEITVIEVIEEIKVLLIKREK